MSLGRKAPIAAAIVAGLLPAGSQIGYARTLSPSTVTTTATIPLDNTKPQSTEGAEYTSLNTNYTVKRADSLLEIEVFLPHTKTNNSGGVIMLALFRDNGVDALAMSYSQPDTLNYGYPQSLIAVVPAAVVGATTFKLRWGMSSVFTGTSAGSFDGAEIATMTVKEISTVDIAVGGFPASYSTIVTPWVSEPLTITAATTNPTKGTIVNDKIWWRRIGDSMECRIDYEQSTAGSAGSGAYYFTIPGGYSMDSSKLRFYTGSAGGVGSIANGVNTDQATFTRGFYLLPYDATRFRLGDYIAGFYASGVFPLSGAKNTFSVAFTVPIVGWS